MFTLKLLNLLILEIYIMVDLSSIDLLLKTKMRLRKQ